jgi:hypothetical protein
MNLTVSSKYFIYITPLLAYKITQLARRAPLRKRFSPAHPLISVTYIYILKERSKTLCVPGI